MVAAVSGVASDPPNPKTTAASQDEPSRRPPLLPSEKDHGNGLSNNNQRGPKSRVVSSRYMSPSTSSTSTSNSSPISSSSSSSSASRRFPSPLISRSSNPLSNPHSLGPKRPVSADRRRQNPTTRDLMPDLVFRNGNASEISAATKLLVTSTRSFSVSFQGESFSLPVSKTKVTPSNSTSLRKGTPERRSITPSRGKVDHVEKSKLSNQHNRWPARNRSVTTAHLFESSDYCGEKSRLIGSVNTIRESIDEKRPSLELSASCDPIQSDSDSVSSDSTSGVRERDLNGARVRAASARFWQQTNSRLRRLHDPGSPLSTSPGSKLAVPSKSKRYSSDGPLLSSPVRGVVRHASPGKVMSPAGSSRSRAAHSPYRIRNAVSTISNGFVETPSVLSFAVDVRRGKVGDNRIFDAHMLRLIYNRHLQWRFGNARTESVLLVQKHSAEKNLWNAWIAISDLRDTVTKKRHRLQLLRQKLKLASILRGQMRLLEDWTSLEKDNSISLNGAIEALEASTLRLPVVDGAIANVQSLKDAIGSAVDVMQAVSSSIYSLLPMVEEVNFLVTELAKVTVKERAFLEQCMDFVSLSAAMQVQDSSLRTHIIQRSR